MTGQQKRVFFGIVTNIQYHDKREFIGFEITLDNKHTFRFPCIMTERSAFGIGRRIFIDLSAWPREAGTVFIHVFKSDDEMKKECDGTVDGENICYVKSYLLLKEFIPWAI